MQRRLGLLAFIVGELQALGLQGQFGRALQDHLFDFRGAPLHEREAAGGQAGQQNSEDQHETLQI